MSGTDAPIAEPVAPARARLTGEGTPSDRQDGGDDLDSKLAGGVAWFAGMRWFAQAGAWLSTVLVARILSVDDYGIVGVAALFVSFSTYLTEAGVARTIVVQRIDDERTLRHLHGACIAIGLVLAAIIAIATPSIASFYNDARIGPVLLLMSTTFVIGGINAVPMARLQRRLAYRTLATNELVRAVAQMCTVLGLAILGAGYWSQSCGIVLAACVGAALNARHAWISPALPRAEYLRVPLRYAAHMITANVLWYVYSNADFAVVARVLEVTALGMYQFAWNIAQLPGEKITNVLQMAAGPLFGSVGHDKAQLRRYLLIVTESLALVIFPVLAGFALVADVAIPLIFGLKWLPAVPALRLLVVYAIPQNLMVLLALGLASGGLARKNAGNSLLFVLVLPPLFWVAAERYGIEGVAGVWMLVQPLMFALPLLQARRGLGLALRDYVAALLPAGIGTLVMMIAVVVAGGQAEALGGAARLLLMVACGVVTYVAVLLVFFRRRLYVLKGVWVRRGS